MRAATVYLHIGIHKTGTKSIQNTLFDNRDALLARDINYLSIARNHGPKIMSLVSDAPHKYVRNIRHHIDTREKAALHNAEIRQHLTEALSSNKSQKLVISGEGFCKLPARKLERLKQILDPYASGYRVIVYARDPYQYLNSAELQRVKAGGILGEDQNDIPLPGYREKIQQYIAAFGRENIDIRIFDSARFVGGGLVADFLAALGEPSELVRSLNVVTANRSMSHEAAMILSELNKAVPSLIDGRANPSRAPRFHQYVTEIEGAKYYMEPNLYLKYEADVLADLEWLHETIGEKVFDRPIPRPASVPSWGENTRCSLQKLAGEMSHTIRRLRPRTQDFLPINEATTLSLGGEWHAGLIRSGVDPSVDTPAPSTRLDAAAVRSIGCFLHERAFAIHRLRETRRGWRGFRWRRAKNIN